MAPATSAKKKGVSFVKADKVSVDTSKQQADKKKLPISALKKTSAAAASSSAQKNIKKTSAKKESVSKINRLAAASKIAAAPAGKKNKKTSSKKSTSSTKKAKKDKKKCPPYVALQLRNLPDAFQEPQLRKFLSQFKIPITQMFVQRTKKRATSRGLAYIRFNPKGAEQEKVLDIILEEVSAMNLGGKTVSAKWVTMKRRMPTRKTTDARRQVEYLNKTTGAPLDQHDTRHFDWVARLQRAAKNETTGNKFLKSIGVNYSFSGFNDQLPLLTKNVKQASSKAQSAVKLTRLATTIGRRKGFNNKALLKKVLEKKRATRRAARQRRAEKKKGAKKETTATQKRAPTTSPKRPAAGKKPAAKK